MTKRKIRNFSNKFKAGIALEALKGEINIVPHNCLGNFF